MKSVLKSWWQSTTTAEKSALLTLAVILAGIGVFSLGIKLGSLLGQSFS